jgi:hypothetical protein
MGISHLESTDLDTESCFRAIPKKSSAMAGIL